MLKTLYFFYFIYNTAACKLDDNQIKSVLLQPSISDTTNPTFDTMIDLDISPFYVEPQSSNNVLNVLSNDTSQQYTIESIDQPTSGTLQISSSKKSLIFNPESDFQGDITIQFSVNRTGGVITQESFSIHQGYCSGDNLINSPFANSGQIGIDGSGAGKEFKICTGTQLQNISTQLDKFFILGRNIGLSEISEFQPIGNSTTPFSGSLDGQGYSIDQLKYSSCSSECGMFGATSDSAVLRNFHLTNVNIVGVGFNSGSVVGDHSGLIEYVSVRGNIIGGSGLASL